MNKEYKGKVVYLTGGEVSPSGMLIKPLYGYPVVFKKLHCEVENTLQGEQTLYFLEFEGSKNTDFYNEFVVTDLMEIGVENKKYYNDIVSSRNAINWEMYITTKEDIEEIRKEYTKVIKMIERIILRNFHHQLPNLTKHMSDVVKKEEMNPFLLGYIENGWYETEDY